MYDLLSGCLTSGYNDVLSFQLFGVGNPMFMDDMSLGLGGQIDVDAQSKVRTQCSIVLILYRHILAFVKSGLELFSSTEISRYFYKIGQISDFIKKTI